MKVSITKPLFKFKQRMAHRYKYQLIILGTIKSFNKDIGSVFLKTVYDLKMSPDSIAVLNESNLESTYKSNQPSFVIYFGDEKGNHQNLAETQKLIDSGVAVLPVFKNSFSKEIPKILENQNGLQYDDSKDQKIVNLALESFGRLRNTRKVFVSYRRNESSSVAIQLYEALEGSNFDVFLDTHSIKQGEPFQDELWHRMSDCDVIVLLNTPKFLDSYWCKEEIAEASAKKIGVVQVVWPENQLGVSNEICYPINLTKADFIDGIYDQAKKSRLEDLTVSKIMELVESIRARNLASRQDGLINEFLSVSQKLGKKMCLQPERFITEILPDDKRRLFIPSVGIPQSLDCHQSEEIREQIKEYDIEKLHLIYDDLRIRKKWLKHLDWLNMHLEIKTIKKNEFEKWLGKN